MASRPKVGPGRGSAKVIPPVPACWDCAKAGRRPDRRSRRCHSNNVPVRDRVCYTDGSQELASKATARSGAKLLNDHRETRPVKPAPFTYHRPATLAEAVPLLAELAPQDGRVLAGGQSLVPIMAFRLARPAHRCPSAPRRVSPSR